MRKSVFVMLRMFVLGVLMMPIVSCDKDTDGDDIKQTVEEDAGETKEFFVKAIDLGLSVKWASCNVGASSPEDYGGYYAWGETEEKRYYSFSNYKWSDDEGFMTKYCTSSYYGIVDNKTVLDPEDDVAHAKWGGRWRMPTLEEMQELVDECTWTKTALNGINGYNVMGPNGNSIFLPAAGDREGTDIDGLGSDGYYWSATSHGTESMAENLYFGNNGSWCNKYSCSNGRPVRPVTD